MATKETAKKTAEKTIKNEVKCNATKEIPKVPKATTQVPLKKETPKKNESISKAESISKETIKNVEVKGTKKVEKETTKEKSFEKRPSAGKQIRDLFTENIAKITSKEMEILTSTEKTKEVLKIRYAFIKKATENKEDRKVNGNARYGSKTIEINGTEYWLTNDLYSKQVPIFEKWIKTIK